ncbi:DUF3493 domain-containing protein [Synechococcus sp. RSCCF101]|uniref:DUF3493 domain-containing protein n=1 Tax=Synechococcus sp. RSCCF101 TaxID=2511069 RepID=UPI00177CF961|nr:DUF3493 domain-containing protein [Synechococcus sp. RSCCF101]
MGEQDRSSGLDPELRRRLLAESRTPWRGLRRGLWLAFAGSGAIGLMVMLSRLLGGGEVAGSDLLLQLGAFLLFAALLWWDRNRDSGSPGGDLDR